MSKLHGRLEIHYSKRDRCGNCYWAVRFRDYATGFVVEGTTTGGEGNINCARLGWTTPGEWDGGIETLQVEHPIREFHRMTKYWPHLGCAPEQIQTAIKLRLAAHARLQAEVKIK